MTVLQATGGGGAFAIAKFKERSKSWNVTDFGCALSLEN